MTFSFTLPQSLSGSLITITDSIGEKAGEAVVDPTGQASVTLNPYASPFSLTLSGSEIEKTPAFKEAPVGNILILCLITVILTALIFYVIGRMSCLKILKQLREVITEKDLD